MDEKRLRLLFFAPLPKLRQVNLDRIGGRDENWIRHPVFKMKTNRSKHFIKTKISPFSFSSYSEKVSFRIFSRKNNLFREKSKNNIFHICIETKNSELRNPSAKH